MHRAQVLNGVRAGAVALVALAIVAQAAVTIGEGVFNPSRFFAYFTIQSNLIGAVALTLLVLRGRRPRSRSMERLRGAAAVYLTVTFFVTILLLSGADVGLQLGWVDFVLHKVIPVVVVLDWLLDPPTARLGFRDALLWLVYPVVWTGVTLLRGAADGWYPYPFLDPANGGYDQVALTAALVTVGYLVISMAVVALGNARGAHGRTRVDTGDGAPSELPVAR